MYTMLYGNKWIKAAWKKELLKETNSIKDKAITIMCYILKKIASCWMEKRLKKTENYYGNKEIEQYRAIKARLKKDIKEKQKEE